MCPFNWNGLNCVRYTLTFCNKIQLNIDIHLERHEANVMRMHPIKKAPAKMITKTIMMTKKKGKFFQNSAGDVTKISLVLTHIDVTRFDAH